MVLLCYLYSYYLSHPSTVIQRTKVKTSTIVLKPHCCYGDSKSRKANFAWAAAAWHVVLLYASNVATLVFHTESCSTSGHMFSCAVRCFVERKALEMVPSLTTADTDGFFMREPEGCEPLTNGPLEWGRCPGEVHATLYFFLLACLSIRLWNPIIKSKQWSLIYLSIHLDTVWGCEDTCN